MTLPDINTKISNLTNTDTSSNQYSNSDRLIDINIWNRKIVSMILDSQDESDFDDIRQTNYPIKTIPLTTNRDYPIPQTEKMLKIKNLSICYDGVNSYRALPYSVDEGGLPVAPSTATAANSQIDSNFNRTSPRYDIKWNSIWVYPAATAADVTAGGYMTAEWFRAPLDFTLSDMSDSTVIPGFDDLFHAILAYGPAFEYCQSKDLPQTKAISIMLQDYENRLKLQYSSKQTDRHYQLAGDYQSYK